MTATSMTTATMNCRWTPNVEFPDRLSKKATGNVMRAVGVDRIASMLKLPKHEAVHRTEAHIGGHGYMPDCLTTPADEDAVADEADEASADEDGFTNEPDGTRDEDGEIAR